MPDFREKNESLMPGDTESLTRRLNHAIEVILNLRTTNGGLVVALQALINNHHAANYEIDKARAAIRAANDSGDTTN